MFKVINMKKMATFVVAIIISCGIAFFIYKAQKVNTVPKYSHTIVIDAGHGGRDVK